MRTRILTISLAVALLFSGGATAGAQTVGDPYGICVDLTRNSGDYGVREQAMEKFVETGASSLRVPMSWDNLYRDGRFIYDIYDAAMETARNYQVSLLGTISASGANGANAWARPAEFAAYLKEVLTRYRFYITDWEAMPNVDAMKINGKSVEPSQYFSNLKEMYALVKEINKNSRLILGCQANVNSDFLDGLFAAGAQEYFDVLSISTFQKPERIPSICKKLSETMAKYGVSKPVWITSYSANSAPGTAEAEVEQAACVARSYILALSCGAEKLFWNCLRSSESKPEIKAQYNGLYHPNFSAKPSAKAYKALSQMMPAGSTKPSVKTKSGNYLASWTRPDGTKVWAAWNPSGSGSIEPIITGKAKIYDYMGSKYKSKEVSLNANVIFLVGAENVEL